MRASVVWEALLVTLLIIAVVGAFSAWSVYKSRGKKPLPAVEQASGEPAVKAALDAVRLYAPFALRINGAIHIEQGSVQYKRVSTNERETLWHVSGTGSGDSIDAAKFLWVVLVAQRGDELQVQSVRLNGNVIFAAEEDSAEAEPSVDDTPAAK
jgi:hypothetical protein